MPTHKGDCIMLRYTKKDLLEEKEFQLEQFEEDGDAWHLEEVDAIDQLLEGKADEDYEACNYDYLDFGD